MALLYPKTLIGIYVPESNCLILATADKQGFLWTKSH